MEAPEVSSSGDSEDSNPSTTCAINSILSSHGNFNHDNDKTTMDENVPISRAHLRGQVFNSGTQFPKRRYCWGKKAQGGSRILISLSAAMRP